MGKDGYGNLDPQSLERAARAVRELNQSPHAKEALHSQIKWSEQKKEQYKTRQKQLEIEKCKEEVETKNKLKDIELATYKEKQQHYDQQERLRHTDKLQSQEKALIRNNELTEQSLKRQEEIKKQAIQYEYEKKEKLLEKQYHQEAIKAIKVRKETHDLEQKDILLKEQENRQTSKELLGLYLNFVGDGFKYLNQNKSTALTISIYLGLASFGVYTFRNLANVGYQLMVSRLFQPTLIRDTSRRKLQNIFLDKTDIYKNVILNDNLQQSLKKISNSIINRKQNIAPLRNICFYGPPGTGKTLFAKQLSYYSGMDYAILSGSDVSQLENKSVQEINKVFDWVQTNRKGTILFVDEADALFRKRDSQMSENLRNSINTFLYRTGTPNKRFMMVIATNQPQQLDSALIDRIDQFLCFDLPKQQEREELLRLFLQKYCNHQIKLSDRFIDLFYQPTSLFFSKKLVKIENINDKDIQNIAQQLDGFSCREIEKFIVYSHDSAFYLENPILNFELLQSCCETYKLQHLQKQVWTQ